MNDGGMNTDPYAALGVRPFINCASVRTAHSGSLMLPQVRAAVDRASRHYVSMDELMDGASRRIAELTGAEWGIVTCGSAAALTLATTACVAGNDPARMLRLPFTEGWVNRVIMVKSHRFAYDQAIRMVGTHIVEIETLADLDAALEEPVAMIAVLGTHEAACAVRLEDMVARARPRGIPVLVDAASEHIARPSPYLARGADMVIYSGGKFLRGPQTSGLLLGRRALVEAAWRNASPHQAFARGMKVSKEDIVGVLAALEVWFEQRDPAEELRRWTADLETIRKQLDLPGIRATIVPPHGVVLVPLLTVEWDALPERPDGPAVRARLLDNDPRVMIDDMTLQARSLGIDPFGLQPGEAVQVAHALRAALTETAVATQVATPAAPSVDLSGLWDVTVSFLQGERTHLLDLTQRDGTVAGSQRSPQFQGPVTGSLHGGDVHLTFRMRYEGTDIVYRLDGSVADGTMRGMVTLGSATDHHKGAVNLAQFGTGRFQAERRAA